jgi:hypothetical protein
LQVLADADISYVGMIKALLLIIKPPWAWEHIFHARRGVGFVLFIHLLPLLVLTGAANWYGLSHWGEMLREPQRVRLFTPGQAAVFEIAHLILSLGVVFIGTWLIKALGETFHGRHRFGQTFRVVAYGLSPLFLLRLTEVHPAVNPWLAWAIGITLTIRVLYSGIPKIMEPDPPHAFGLFLMSSIFLLFITGLIRFITDWYLQGRFVRLQPFVDSLADKLPF